MKLTVDELKNVISSVELALILEHPAASKSLLTKLNQKLNEITGKESRLLSNSELKNIGL